MSDRWEHNLVYVENGTVIEEITVTHGGRRPDPVLPMSVDEYIDLMADHGYQFCGSYAYRNGTAIVMKRLDSDGPIRLMVTQTGR